MIVRIEKGATVWKVAKSYHRLMSVAINQWTLLMKGRGVQGLELVRVWEGQGYGWVGHIRGVRLLGFEGGINQGIYREFGIAFVEYYLQSFLYCIPFLLTVKLLKNNSS